MLKHLRVSCEGVHDFAPGACDRVEQYLLSELVGQEVAVLQVSDAVCDHLAKQEPHKPLVISAHGPPGVGKSLMHLLLARVLYNRHPSNNTPCPGSACLGYKVVYGLDYTASARSLQHDLLKAAILDHFRYHPESLLVIEEYDKLDCPTRGLLKQLIDSSHSTNVTINRSIIMLESNLGTYELHKLLIQAGSRKVPAEAAQKVLKDLMFTVWAERKCESLSDTVKMLSLINFYLPFLPLERDQIRQLFEIRLQQRAQEVMEASRDVVTWNSTVIDFLASKVDFDGRFPVEGAKEVSTLMTRYVSRALRKWAKQQQLAAAQETAGKPKGLLQIPTFKPKPPPRRLSLLVDPLGTGLTVAARSPPL